MVFFSWLNIDWHGWFDMHVTELVHSCGLLKAGSGLSQQVHIILFILEQDILILSNYLSMWYRFLVWIFCPLIWILFFSFWARDFGFIENVLVIEVRLKQWMRLDDSKTSLWTKFWRLDLLEEPVCFEQGGWNSLIHANKHAIR